MPYFKALWILIQYLPAVVDALQRGEALLELKIKLGKVDDGIDQAKSTKDTSGLEKLLDPPSDSGPPPAAGNH